MMKRRRQQQQLRQQHIDPTQCADTGLQADSSKQVAAVAAGSVSIGCQCVLHGRPAGQRTAGRGVACTGGTHGAAISPARSADQSNPANLKAAQSNQPT